MRFILILACLALYAAYTQAQCRGAVPNNQVSCIGGRDQGDSRNEGCRRNSNNLMWFFDPRTALCSHLFYRGCGGSPNRFCTRADCERRCRR